MQKLAKNLEYNSVSELLEWAGKGEILVGEKMSNDWGFALKNVYPSELGLHLEHYTEAEAQAAYRDAKSKGINNVEVDGLILTWKFYNPKISPDLLASATGSGFKKRNINRCTLRRPQLLKQSSVILGKRLAHSKTFVRPSHFSK